MDRLMFEYKYDVESDAVQFKPYCFRWVLAYRLKELYLRLFFNFIRPFVALAFSLRRVRQGERIVVAVKRERQAAFKVLRLEKK